jgi:hypothetical protein
MAQFQIDDYTVMERLIISKMESITAIHYPISVGHERHWPENPPIHALSKRGVDQFLQRSHGMHNQVFRTIERYCSISIKASDQHQPMAEIAAAKSAERPQGERARSGGNLGGRSRWIRATPDHQSMTSKFPQRAGLAARRGRSNNSLVLSP